jgi:hypothetical protein
MMRTYLSSLFFLLAAMVPLVVFAGDHKADPFAVARFHFDEKADGTARDEVERGARVTLGDGAEWSPDGFKGGALRLQRRGQKGLKPTTLELPAALLERSGFRIELRFKLSEAGGTWRGRTQYLFGGSRSNLRFSVDRGAFGLGLLTKHGWAGVSTERQTFQVKPGQWYHATASYDLSELRFYIDGKLIGVTPARDYQPETSLRIGAVGWADAPGEDLNGWIDELSVSAYPYPDGVDLAATESPSALKLNAAGGAPSVRIPKCTMPPPLNGQPTGQLWDGASWVGNPIALHGTEISSKIDMQTGLLWDANALYVGFRVQGFRQPLASSAPGGANLNRDDTAEITLRVPGLVKEQAVAFTINCQGVKTGTIGGESDRHPVWEGRAAIDGTSWSATVKIPFSELGAKPKPGDKWPANFGAYLAGYASRPFLWSTVGTGDQRSSGFGELEFGADKSAAGSIGRIVTQLSQVSVAGAATAPGKVRMLLFPQDGSAATKAKAEGNVIENFEDAETSRAVQHSIATIDKAGPWNAALANVRAGSYWLKTAVFDANNRPINVDWKPVKISRSIETRVLPYPVAGSASAKVTIYNMGTEGVTPAHLEVRVADATGALLRRFDQSLKGAAPMEHLIPLGKLTNETNYKITARATSADGRTSIEDSCELRLPRRPEWADTKAGDLEGRVPKPWTPVQAQNGTLSCWGRSHEFGDGLLPAKITSSGQPILNAPMRVIANAGTRSAALQHTAEPAKFQLSDTGDRAEFFTTASSELADASVKGTLEFDGLMEVSLTVRPKTDLDGVTLELPLTSSVAQLMQPMPGATNRDKAGRIPAQGVRSGPVNSLWICNESAGIYFAADSTEGWQAPNDQALEVTPENGRTMVRFRFHKGSPLLHEARTWRFYLQATPVRPFNPDWFESGSRVANGLTWGASPESLRAFKELGGKTLIFFEHWTHAQNGGWSKREDDLKQIIARCHELDLKVILYFGFEIGDLPEHADMIEESKRMVDKPANFYTPQQQNTFVVSYGGPYQEYLLHHMARLKRDLHIDGVYLDGTLRLVASDNPAFGCGYLGADGKRIPTVPLRRIRDFAKRINALFVQDGGTVFAHHDIAPPTMGFVSNIYLGEHLGFLNTAWESIPQLIPEEAALSTYNQMNTGVPVVLCQQLMWPGGRNRPNWFEPTFAWSALHGVGINVLFEKPISEHSRKVMEFNRLLGEFGADRCEWIPYWQTDRLPRIEPSDFKVSLYRRPDGAAVCIIANQTGLEKSGTLDVSRDVRCADFLTRAALPQADGKLPLTLPGYGCQVIQIDAPK